MNWPLLDGLSQRDRELVLASTRRRRFARREVVFHQGDLGDDFHLVARGRLAVQASTPLGDVVTLVVVGPGDFFGELALLDPASRRNATVIGLEPAETLVLTGERFNELRRENPSVNRVLVEALAARLLRMTDRWWKRSTFPSRPGCSTGWLRLPRNGTGATTEDDCFSPRRTWPLWPGPQGPPSIACSSGPLAKELWPSAGGTSTSSTSTAFGRWPDELCRGLLSPPAARMRRAEHAGTVSIATDRQSFWCESRRRVGAALKRRRFRRAGPLGTGSGAVASGHGAAGRHGQHRRFRGLGQSGFGLGPRMRRGGWDADGESRASRQVVPRDHLNRDPAACP